MIREVINSCGGQVTVVVMLVTKMVTLVTYVVICRSNSCNMGSGNCTESGRIVMGGGEGSRNW